LQDACQHSAGQTVFFYDQDFHSVRPCCSTPVKLV
jgi:hypothetical protein